ESERKRIYEDTEEREQGQRPNAGRKRLPHPETDRKHQRSRDQESERREKQRRRGLQTDFRRDEGRAPDDTKYQGENRCLDTSQPRHARIGLVRNLGRAEEFLKMRLLSCH